MRGERPIGYTWLLTGVTLWLGLVFLAPFARQQGWPSSPLLYEFFARVCHQIPERSFHAFGHPLGVCHRCLGLYAGFGVGMLVWPRLHGMREALLGRPRVVVLFVVPMLIDVLFVPNTYWTRFATGFVGAFPLGLLALKAAEQVFAARTQSGGVRRLVVRSSRPWPGQPSLSTRCASTTDHS